MKKISVLLLILILLLTPAACSGKAATDESSDKSASYTQPFTAQVTESESKTYETEKGEKMNITIRINGRAFSATLENNAAAKELYEIIRTEGLSVDMSDYSGFEKVGALGRTLTSDDKYIKAAAGDIMLYQSNQIVMFYGSNSWSYTKLGRINDLSGWRDALGSGSVTAEITAE